MTVQEVKNKIESNEGLVESFLTSSIDITKNEYTRLKLEYIINIEPEYNAKHTFIAHGISGSYTMDKNYDYTLNIFKSQRMKNESKDYLNSLVGSTITTWDILLTGDSNPEMCYTKVWQDIDNTVTPKAWLLTKSESAITHTETTFDQFPIDEY